MKYWTLGDELCFANCFQQLYYFLLRIFCCCSFSAHRTAPFPLSHCAIFSHPISVFTSSNFEFAAIVDKQKRMREWNRANEKSKENQGKNKPKKGTYLLKYCNTILFWMELNWTEQQQKAAAKSVEIGILWVPFCINSSTEYTFILWKTLQLDTRFNLASCSHPYPMTFFPLFMHFFLQLSP